MSKSKTYDCFYFCDELDLLEIRLNVLEDFVDYFVIVESSETFMGKQKELLFDKNKNRYSRWAHKIIYHTVQNFPNNKIIYQKALNSLNTGNKEHYWVREFYQKESLMLPLMSVCADDDLIFISDLDEFWDPKILPLFPIDGEVYRPIQTAYTFYLNTKSDQPHSDWTGTRICNFKTLKQYGANHIRTEREIQSILINNGGWHFSWLGKHTHNKWNDNHPNNSLRYMKAHKYNLTVENEYLPEYLKNNMPKWKKYFKE